MERSDWVLGNSWSENCMGKTKMKTKCCFIRSIFYVHHYLEELMIIHVKAVPRLASVQQLHSSQLLRYENSTAHHVIRMQTLTARATGLQNIHKILLCTFDLPSAAWGCSDYANYPTSRHTFLSRTMWNAVNMFLNHVETCENCYLRVVITRHTLT